jgi:hypothetical protein
MPSRTVTFAIIAFWLLTAGWFIVREGQPFYRTGEPPPYAIEFSDEALQNAPPTRWTCSLHGTKIGTISTALSNRPADDTFELQAKSPNLKLLDLNLPGIGPVTVSAIDYADRVRVTRDGDLRAMRTTVSLVIEGIGTPITARLELSAEVRGNRLDRYVSLTAPGLGPPPQLESTAPPHGSVLNPMHPVPRIAGLRFGQTWRQPLTDPRTGILRAALSHYLPGKTPMLPEAPSSLVARVLPEPQLLEWPGESHMCFVIEYRDGEDYVARTWVRMSDAAVVRQEAGAHGETLVLQRE